MTSLEITPSTSDKGSPWQNGFQERFYGSFKTELGSLKGITSEGELYERISLTQIIIIRKGFALSLKLIQDNLDITMSQ